MVMEELQRLGLPFQAVGDGNDIEWNDRIN
jgi:hypothetical protein